MKRVFQFDIYDCLKKRKIPCQVILSEPHTAPLQVSLLFDTTEITEVSFYYSSALEKIKNRLSKKGLYLLCNDSRNDIIKTGLVIDMSLGASAYLNLHPELPFSPENTELVYLLDPVENLNLIRIKYPVSMLAKFIMHFYRLVG